MLVLKQVHLVIQSYMIYKAGSCLTDTFGNGVGGRRPVTGYINMYNPTSGTRHTPCRFLGGTHFDTNVQLLMQLNIQFK